LTGLFLDSIGSQIGHIPFDYKKMKWSKKGSLNYLLFPVETEKLPDLVAPGEIIGKIIPSAAKLTGIKEGTPVIACGSDKGCETIGMGIIDTSKASLSFGTTATVQTTSKNYFEAIKFMPPYPAVIPGYYNPEVEIFRGYWMITWFKNEFGYKEKIEAEKNGVIPEIELNKLLKQVPPGSMGLMLHPSWGPGLKHPEAKGAIIGFGGVHKRAHVYRAVIEGLAYALLEGMHSIEKASKTKISEAGVSGGASRSDEICQISADIFNLPLYRGVTHETSALGAAIVSAVGLKVYKDFNSAIKNMVKVGKTFYPNEENTFLYNELYKRVYRKMYKSLKPLYKDIRDIVGYPEKI
ncbi:MAG: FGGY-family carbohydrate kinase, partial [Deferribacterota bacterium]|nr:FGGY-family carbohydrate kinase [Deferribacterota bacterium]